TAYPTLTGTVPGLDVDPPVPGNPTGLNYTTFYDGNALNIYWRAATDDTTAQDELAYRVLCQPIGLTASVAMDWTLATALAVEASGRFWFPACTDPGSYQTWVQVRDAAENVSTYPYLSGSVPGGDVTAPTLPSTVGNDYSVYYDGSALNVYWRPATDDTTAQADLEYRVTCDGGVALDWTAGVSVPVEASSRYWWPACNTSGSHDVVVTVRDEGGNETAWPTLTGSVP
ncbi:MAG: hypothetical protein KC656_18645, partial [Myxococcales bacterium]|nr:hypothetical protein [Myxococcales bacterium]